MAQPIDWLTIADYVAACVDDPGLSPILADLVADHDADLGQRLRAACHLLDLADAARLCGQHGRSVRRRVRAQAEEWARVVRGGRRVDPPRGWADPELGPFETGRPTLREAEGSRAYCERMMSVSLTLRMRWLRSLEHCRRLVTRCLSGYDVPSDVQQQCGHYAECIRHILRTTRPEWADGGGDDSVILGKP